MAGLGASLQQAVRALHIPEDWARLNQLGRRLLAPNQVVLPEGPPGAGSAELGRLLVGPSRGLDVALGAALIAAEDDPTVDVRAVLEEVEHMAWLLRRRLRRAPPGAATRLEILNRVFFEELGF